jgi:hypothetical protein
MDAVTETGVTAERRTPLTRDRVLGAAVDLADRGGYEGLSMRNTSGARMTFSTASWR